jgi:hypothetical protein
MFEEAALKGQPLLLDGLTGDHQLNYSDNSVPCRLAAIQEKQFQLLAVVAFFFLKTATFSLFLATKIYLSPREPDVTMTASLTSPWTVSPA